MKEEVENWIYFAKEDLKIAQIALKEKIYNQVCFHFHQCIEKVLKAIIINRGKIHPKTHSRAELLHIINDDIFNDIQNEIISMDRFYIPTRYPDALPGALPEGLPTEEEAKQSLEIAKKVLDKIKW